MAALLIIVLNISGRFYFLLILNKVEALLNSCVANCIHSVPKF